MNSIQSQLNRLRHTFRNQMIEVKATKHFKHNVEVFGKIIGPLIAGNHYKMEYWIAKVFAKYQFIEFVGSEEIDLLKLNKLADSENRSNEIKQLDPFLYTAITEHMEIKPSEWSTEKGGFRRTNMSGSYHDLMMVRHRKILDISKLSSNHSFSQKFTEEEKILLERVASDVREWKQYFFKMRSKKT